MNEIDLTVIEILGIPTFKYGKWFVKCKVTAYGRASESQAMFSSEADALAFKIWDTIRG